VQYGPQVQATALYLGGYQLLPFQRLAETFSELFPFPRHYSRFVDCPFSD